MGGGCMIWVEKLIFFFLGREGGMKYVVWNEVWFSGGGFLVCECGMKSLDECGYVCDEFFRFSCVGMLACNKRTYMDFRFRSGN